MSDQPDKRLICNFCGEFGKVSQAEDGRYFVSARCETWKRMQMSPGCRTQLCQAEDEAISRWERMWEDYE